MNKEILSCNKSISGLESMVSYHRANIIFAVVVGAALMALVVSL